MAEQQAGQSDALSPEVRQQIEVERGEAGAAGKQGEQQGGDKEQQRQEQQPAGKTYSQEELDRILGKVRKNARYLGRKEAEAELRAQGATPAQARETVDRQQDKANDEDPVRKDDEPWEDWMERKAAHAGRKAAREERAKLDKEEADRKQSETAAERQREFKQRSQKYIEENPEFLELLEDAGPETFISKPVGAAIQESDVGIQILHHLLKNRDEAQRIAALSENAQIRAIGKLEAKFEAEAAAKGGTKGDKKDGGKDGGDAGDDDDEGGEGDKNSRQSDDQPERKPNGQFKPAKKAAPEPIEPVGGRSGDTSSMGSDKDDMATWLRKENARARKEGRH